MSNQKTIQAYLALFMGENLATAQMVAATTDPEAINTATETMLVEIEQRLSHSQNPVLIGRQTAVRLVRQSLKKA